MLYRLREHQKEQIHNKAAPTCLVSGTRKGWKVLFIAVRSLRNFCCSYGLMNLKTFFIRNLIYVNMLLSTTMRGILTSNSSNYLTHKSLVTKLSCNKTLKRRWKKKIRARKTTCVQRLRNHFVWGLNNGANCLLVH